MNKPALKAAGRRGGITETLNTIVNTLNDLVTDFMGSGLMGNNTATTNFTIEGAMSNTLRNWEDLDGVNRKFGSLYYFSKLMGNSSFVNGHEREHYDDQNIVNEVRQGKSRYQPTFSGIYDKESKEIEPYSNNRNCISNECLENSILLENKEKLSILPIPMDI